MKFLDELDFGDEIRGVICPDCGGSLVWNDGKPYCYDHGTVKPEREGARSRLGKEEKEWLAKHSHELEPEIE